MADNKATKKLSGLTQPTIIPLGSSGVLSVVLDFLKRCENETFEGVMASVGGDLKTPSLWINILVSASFKEQSWRKIQIVQNIGPLVRCMVNDKERTFFKSNKYWRQGIAVFVLLVLNVIQVQDRKQLEDMQIVEMLLQHEGLLRTIIQCGFWKEFRPDIVMR